MTECFLDTSAILGFLNGDEGLARRLRSSPFRTGPPNLAEAHFAQLAVGVAPEEADRNLAPFEAAAIDAPPPVVRAAARLLLAHQHWGLAAALAYAHARHLGIPLLSADPSFQGVPGADLALPTRRRP